MAPRCSAIWLEYDQRGRGDVSTLAVSAELTTETDCCTVPSCNSKTRRAGWVKCPRQG
jgi:hypothetical protein